MSDRQAEEEFIAGMRESGKMAQILGAMSASQPADAPADADTAEVETTDGVPADTVETTTGEVEETPYSDEALDAEDESEDEEVEDDGLFLDVTPEVEAVLAKYGGDLNKALAALGDSQSTIGRQGNELGELRQQLQRLEALTIANQPPVQWPDLEEVEPMEAVNQLHAIAERAFAMADPNTFQVALQQMGHLDPIRTQMYANQKAAEIQAAAAASQPEANLQQQVEAFQARNPKINDPEVQQAIGEEMQRFPSLARILRGEDPSVSSEERINALQEVYDRVTSRQVADTVSQAARRVAIKTSEEARAARAAARVATSDQRGNTAVTEEDQPDTVIDLKSSHGGRFNVSQMHRETAELADQTPEMVLRGGRMYVRQPDGTLVPRAE